MNHVYKVIWNISCQVWMVVAEYTKSRGKRKSAILQSASSAAAFLVCIVAMSALALIFTAVPVWADVEATGDVTPTPTPNPLAGDWDISGDDLIVGQNGNGSLTIGNGSTVNSNRGYIGRNAGSNGSVIVDGAGSTWSNFSWVGVGYSGTGSLVIRNGATVSTSVDAIHGAGHIGYLPGSVGNVTVDGEHSTWTGNQSLLVGSQGTGYLTISNGGTASSTVVTRIATTASSTGTINIGAAAGNTAVAAGTLDTPLLEFRDGTGTLVFNHTESAYDFAPNITGSGTINLLSGTTRLTGNSGDLSGYTGLMNVDGGTLSVADGDTLTLGGDYNQTANGIFRTGASSSSSFGQLNITGIGTFAANTTINVDVASSNSLAHGQTLFGVISAGTLNASTFTLSDNSALFNFAAVVNGNQVNLNVSAASARGVTDSVIATGFNPGLGAARVLDDFVFGGTTHTDMDNVVTAFGQLSTDQQVSDAVAQTLPLLVSGTTQVASNTLRHTNRVIQARQSSVRGMSSGDGFLTDRHVWLKPVGSWATQDSRNGVSGYRVNSYGLVAGVDGEMNANTRLGFAVSYMNSDVDGRGSASGNKVDIDAYQAMFYGSRNLQNHPDIELDWQASLGMNKNEGKRTMRFIGRTAKADYDSYTAQIGVGVGKRFELNDTTTLIPSLRADYAYIKDESYTEKGADALNLKVNSNHVDELIVMAQGLINHQLNDSTSVTANAGLGYDLLNETSSLTSSYSGGGAAFTTRGIKPSPWLGRAGVGMNFSTSDATEISARYDVEGRKNFLNQTASVNFRWMF